MNIKLAKKNIPNNFIEKELDFEELTSLIPCECCKYPVEGYGDVCPKCGWEQQGTNDFTGQNPVDLFVYKKLFERYGTNNGKKSYQRDEGSRR